MKKQAEQPVVEVHSTSSQQPTKNITRPRVLYIAVAAAVVLLVIGLFASIHLGKKKQPQTAQKNVDSSQFVCKDDLYKRASVAIKANNVSSLKVITDEIKRKPNYDKDGTCLYILTTYYVTTDDLANAKKTLALYTTFVQHEQKNSLGSDFNTQKLKSLTVAVAALQKSDEAAAKNQVYGPNYKSPDGAQNPNLKKANQ